jgi:excinuclease ABC subunit A
VPDVELSLRRARSSRGRAGQTLEYFLRLLEALGDRRASTSTRPWRKLPQRGQKAIMYGSEDQVHVRYRNKYGRERSYYTGFEGVVQWIERRHSDTDSDWSRERYEGYMRDVPCRACGGTRLKPEILAVTIAGRNIADVCAMSVGECTTSSTRWSSTTGSG